MNRLNLGASTLVFAAIVLSCAQAQASSRQELEEDLVFLERQVETACEGSPLRKDPSRLDTARTAGRGIDSRVEAIRAKVRGINQFIEVSIGAGNSSRLEELNTRTENGRQAALAQAKLRLRDQQERYTIVLQNYRPGGSATPESVESARQALAQARREYEAIEHRDPSRMPASDGDANLSQLREQLEVANGELRLLLGLSDRYVVLDQQADDCIAKLNGEWGERIQADVIANGGHGGSQDSDPSSAVYGGSGGGGGGRGVRGGGGARGVSSAGTP